MGIVIGHGVSFGRTPKWVVNCRRDATEQAGAYDTREAAMTQAQAWEHEFPDARITLYEPARADADV